MLLFYRFLQNLSSPVQPSSLDLFSVRPDRNGPRHGTISSSVLLLPPPSSQQEQVLACSSSSSSLTSGLHNDLIYGSGRRLCEDRRGVFDHLRPRLFVKSTVRVVVMQCTNVVTTYYNEQLKQDMEREERIQKGEITRAQANKEDEEWQEVSVGCCFCRKNDALAALQSAGCCVFVGQLFYLKRSDGCVERPSLKSDCCIIFDIAWTKTTC